MDIEINAIQSLYEDMKSSMNIRQNVSDPFGMNEEELCQWCYVSPIFFKICDKSLDALENEMKLTVH